MEQENSCSYDTKEIGNTPLMTATFKHNLEQINILKHKYDVNGQNNDGHTALHLCIVGFISIHDDKNCEDEECYDVYMECIDSLLKVADVNIRDNGGKTVLMLAAKRNDKKLIKKFLSNNAMIHILDNSGRSALQYLNIGHKSVYDPTCFKLLITAGGDRLLNLHGPYCNTFIQKILLFPHFWDRHNIAKLIKFLLALNCSTEKLKTVTGQNCYDEFVTLDEFDSVSRHELRTLLYRSGSPLSEVIQTLNFKQEEKQKLFESENMVEKRTQRKLLCEERASPMNTDVVVEQQECVKKLNRTISQAQHDFQCQCNNLSLESLCIRVVRHQLGLGIMAKVDKLQLPWTVENLILLKDILQGDCYDVDRFDDDYCISGDDYSAYELDSDDDEYFKYNNKPFVNQLSTDFDKALSHI